MNKECVRAFFCVTYEADIARHPKSQPELLILESNPDVNYYGASVPELKSTPLEHHLFVLADKSECFVDNTFKFIHNLEVDIGKKLHIYPGQLKFTDELFMSLRFRENELEDAMKFFNYLRNNYEIEFKKDIKFSRQKGIVHYKKYIELEELFPDIYKDKNSKRVYFVKLNNDLPLNDFYNVVKQIRRNYRFHSFEPFYAYAMVKYYEIEYFFMFYSPNFTTEELSKLKEALNKEIANL